LFNGIKTINLTAGDVFAPQNITVKQRISDPQPIINPVGTCHKSNLIQPTSRLVT